MNEKDFLKSLQIIYQDITKADSKDLDNVKYYAYKNPNDINVINFKTWFINMYRAPFLNEKLKEALYIPDDFKYQKEQLIAQNLPFYLRDINYQTLFYGLIWNEHTKHFYQTFFNFLKSENQCLIPDDMINRIDTFMSTKKLIINNSDKYHTLEKEINIYLSLLFDKVPSEFSKFKDQQIIEAKLNNKYISYNEILDNFEKTTLGNIGELYIFENIIKPCSSSIFTSRDLGDGFGYDMYYQYPNNNQIIENLVEVKTTTNTSGNDYFTLSPNEYNTLLQTINEHNVDYYICRVFFNPDKIDFNHCFLKLENNLLISTTYNNDGIAYEVSQNDNLCFVRKQKTKTLN